MFLTNLPVVGVDATHFSSADARPWEIFFVTLDDPKEDSTPGPGRPSSRLQTIRRRILPT